MTGGHDWVSTLVTFGIPSTITAAIGFVLRAYIAGRATRRAAPQAQIDTNLARAQAAANLQDGVFDNLKELLDVQIRRTESESRRADAAEERERALHARIADVERQLEQAHAELTAIRALLPQPRTET